MATPREKFVQALKLLKELQDKSIVAIHTYMKALEQASAEQDISAFSHFIAYLVKEGLAGKPVATLP